MCPSWISTSLDGVHQEETDNQNHKLLYLRQLLLLNTTARRRHVPVSRCIFVPNIFQNSKCTLFYQNMFKKNEGEISGSSVRNTREMNNDQPGQKFGFKDIWKKACACLETKIMLQYGTSYKKQKSVVRRLDCVSFPSCPQGQKIKIKF